jgi:hypothetical protein
VCCGPFVFCRFFQHISQEFILINAIGGTTSDFCGNATVAQPHSNKTASSLSRKIGYYEGWSTLRPCDRESDSFLVASSDEANIEASLEMPIDKV